MSLEILETDSPSVTYWPVCVGDQQLAWWEIGWDEWAISLLQPNAPSLPTLLSFYPPLSPSLSFVMSLCLSVSLSLSLSSLLRQSLCMFSYGTWQALVLVACCYLGLSIGLLTLAGSLPPHNEWAIS